MRRGGRHHEPKTQSQLDSHSSVFEPARSGACFGLQHTSGALNERPLIRWSNRLGSRFSFTTTRICPMQTLREAEGRASLIFRRAGVEIEWADCPLNDEDPSLYPKCPAILDATQLFLRIFPRTATKVDVGGEAFVAARIANIFWNRVEEQAQGLNVAAPRFLAHTVAHELGHLLLGSNSHSPGRNHDRALGRANRDSHPSGRFVFPRPTIRTHSIGNEKAKRSADGRRECVAEYHRDKTALILGLTFVHFP